MSPEADSLTDAVVMPLGCATNNSVVPPKSFLILCNIGKKANFGTLLRSAAAFGISEVYVVGEKKLKTFGNQGTTSRLKITFCDNFDQLRACLGDETSICGIEITESAVPVHHHPFSGDTAFMLGNEGTGMTAKQLSICDQFVYIPQYSGATASLNVAIAGSIVLHHFAVWSSLVENPRVGQKFLVEPAPSKLELYKNPTSGEYEHREILREERRKRREEGADPFDVGNTAFLVL